MSQNVPTSLGKYQIIREIARSNDIVYEAYDPVMNRRVALKELAVPGGSTPQQREERVRRFQREVKAAGSLAHPGIVTIYETGEDGGRVYMAMEFLDGQTLRNELDSRGLVAPDRALEIASEVLDSLEYAHANGVIHRDIKPENIQILSNGRIKITDFGIARLVFEPNITMDGQVFGTPSYMSPEQIIGKDIDGRSDIFSIGAVLYEMLAGHKAFQGDNVMSISYAIMNKDPDPPPAASHPVQQILRKALDKSVLMRFATAKEFKEACVAAREAMRAGLVMPTNVTGIQAAYPPPPQIAGAIPPPQVMGLPHAPAPPPYTYGYQPPPQQQAYYVPVPIMVPKPQLPPLLSQETKRTLWFIFGTVLAVGVALGIVYVSMTAFGRAITDKKVKLPEISAPRPSGGSPAAHPSASASAGPPSATANPQIEERLREGDAHMAAGREDFAEDAYSAALELSPTHVEAASKLAGLYVGRAQRETDPTVKARLWERAGGYTAIVAEHSSDPTVRDQFLKNTSGSLRNAGVNAMEAGDRRDARRLFYLARQYVTPGSPEEADILSKLRELGAE